MTQPSIANKPAPAQKRKFSHVKKHWYMVAVEVQYVMPAKVQGADPSMRSKTINIMITPPQKNITSEEIGAIRSLSLLRMQDQYKVTEDQIADLVVMNMMWMGLMSEHEYFTEGSQKVTSSRP